MVFGFGAGIMSAAMAAGCKTVMAPLVAKGVMDTIEQPMPWDQVFDLETVREIWALDRRRGNLDSL